MGSVVEARILPKDTIPVENNVMANTARQMGRATGKSAISIPAAVPTPLPPLNPANMV